MYAMVETLNCIIGLGPQSADDDDTCLEINVGAWPQDVLTPLTRERSGAPIRAQESHGAESHCLCENVHKSVICRMVRVQLSF